MMGDNYQHMWKEYPILKEEKYYTDKEWYKEARRSRKSKSDDEGLVKNIHVFKDVVHDGGEVDSFYIKDLKDEMYE